MKNKYYALVHRGGPRGFVMQEPKRQKQEKKFAPGVFYAVIFFPKITGIGKASANWPRTPETLSSTPEAAISKFMDGIKQGETWATYRDAGHRVRKVKVSDLGEAG